MLFVIPPAARGLRHPFQLEEGLKHKHDVADWIGEQPLGTHSS